MVLVVLLPGQVLAAPEPPPPGDYPGAQYIDRTGCVFVRDGDRWAQRLDKKGAPICGFPPSQPAEGAEADVAPPSPEEVLTEVLAEGLRSGDLQSEAPALPLGDVAPDPAQAKLDATLAKQIELDGRIRSALSGAAPDGLCERLGYKPATTAATPIVGGDVTQGLCPGMVAPSPEPVITSVSDAAAPAGTTEATPVAAPFSPKEVAASAQKPRKPATKAAETPKSGSIVARRPAAAPDKAGPAAEMIPASARYVQIGIYADEANALAALRRLSGMGYRTAQRKEDGTGGAKKAILAGPFADRQALVTALTRLRANGYPRAIAR